MTVGLARIPKWIWLALLLVVAYIARYYPVFAERVLLWDDFFLLADSATLPRFQQAFLYTFLHFIPFLRLSMLGFMQLVPVSLLPLATSLWSVFWVSWLVFAFVRLTRAYGLSAVGAMLGVAFIVFNPMFAEVQVWLTSTFYLVALVFTVEGLAQLERALQTQRQRHWLAAALCSVLAPSAWSTGYIVPALYLVTVAMEWRRLEHKRPALLLVLVSVLAYPALRIVGELVSGHTYQQVTPWDILPTLYALFKLIGDGLVLGSLGLWQLPQDHIRFPEQLLVVTSLLVVSSLLLLYWRTQWRKQIVLALVSVILGLFVPILFRGTQFSYDDLRWFIRYMATPLFGAGLAIAVAAHLCLQRYRVTPLLVISGCVIVVFVSFVNRMPEHYVGGGNQQNKFRAQQVAQLRFLEELFATARRLGIGADPLKDAYFVPVEGAQANMNPAGLYGGHREPNPSPLTRSSYDELDGMIESSNVWQQYQKLSYAPVLSGPILEARAIEGREPVSLLGAPTAFHDIDVLDDPSNSNAFDAFWISGGDPYVSYRVPDSAGSVGRVIIEAEVLGRQNVHLELSLGSKDRSIRNPSVFLWCGKPRCVFDVPVARLPWFPATAYESLRIDPDGLRHPKEEAQLRLWRLAVLPREGGLRR